MLSTPAPAATVAAAMRPAFRPTPSLPLSSPVIVAVDAKAETDYGDSLPNRSPCSSAKLRLSPSPSRGVRMTCTWFGIRQ